MFQKLKDRRRQRRYTQWHREVEHDGPRLMQLDGNFLLTYNGKATWCDTVLYPCPLDGECCNCTHAQSEREGGRR